MSNNFGRCFIFLTVILFIVPVIIFSIISFIVGLQNINTNCDRGEDSIIKLSTWLFVNGIISLVFTIIYGTLFILFLISNKYFYMILFIIFYIINWSFVIVWNILGAFQLFEHSTECKDEASSLWIVTLIGLIFQWGSIFLICFLRKMANYY